MKASYTKVPYDLRPNKQIERRMIISALQRLPHAGLHIADYQYTGMGSIFFVDYIMFHKYLGIHKMLSVEKSGDNRRANFNRPFSEEVLRIEYGAIGAYIHTLKPDTKHILWLDYDYPIIESLLRDLRAAGAQLSEESILLITVDIDPDEHTNPETEEVIDLSTPEARLEHYKKIAGSYFDPKWHKDFFETNAGFIKMTIQVLMNAIKSGIAGRGIEFLPLFNFYYDDGNRMLSFGGLLGNGQLRKKVTRLFKDVPYLRRDIRKDSVWIKAPILTRKEKLYLDSYMPCGDKIWQPEAFNLDNEDLISYRNLYRFYPSYVEMLL